MNKEYLQQLYDTVLGQTEEPYSVPGAENLFEPGKPCDLFYRQAMASYDHICQRLSVPSEDKDLEQIFHSMDAICKLVAFEMFRLGQLHHTN